jgi:16S rRNA (uracil1498-N3)-methyltransferase
VPLFYQPEIQNGAHYLDIDESRHALKVLRLSSGSPMAVTDGKGFTYEAILKKATPQRCEFEIIETKSSHKRPFEVKIGIAPTKNIDRTEWFVEKCVEIGIDHIYFFHSRNSERKTLNLERLIKKAVSAMKQSQQAWLPSLHQLRPFSKVIREASASSKFIAYVDAHNTTTLMEAARGKKESLVLIGPEGDFSTEELQKAEMAGFQKVSLGPNRLRTETAGVVACHTLNLVHH